MDRSRFLSNSEICRTCLIHSDEFTHLVSIDAPESDVEELTIGQKLLQCVPHMDLNVTQNAALCTKCLNAINFVLNFKKVCAQTEEDIQSYVQKVGLSDVNLIDVIQKSGPVIQDPAADSVQKCVRVKHDFDEIIIKHEPLDDSYNPSNQTSSPNATEHEEKNFELVEIKSEAKESASNVHVDGEKEKNDVFICNKCGRCRATKAGLISHLRMHEKQVKEVGHVKRYRCNLCNYKTIVHRRLLLHARRHKENKLLKCTKCEYVCVRSDRLIAHMASHTSSKLYQCPQCDYNCLKKTALIAHITSHTGNRPYNCGQCDYSAILKSSLVRHTRIHTDDKPYKCTLCTYSSRTRTPLTRHMRTHTGDKPYKCSQCDYSSATKAALVMHTKIHTDNRSYRCSECEYSTTCKLLLTEHVRTHRDDKPYTCSVCSYCAKAKRALTRHMRTHTGDKPHKCALCSYCANRKDSLIRHMRTHR